MDDVEMIVCMEACEYVRLNSRGSWPDYKDLIVAHARSAGRFRWAHEL